MKSYQEYESELSRKLQLLKGMDLTSIHLGLEENVFEKKGLSPAGKSYWDNWTVTVTYGGETFTTKFTTGSGFRKPVFGVKSQPNGYYKQSIGVLKDFKSACKAQWLVPTPPTLPDVMYALLSDARCAEGTFEEYCSEFGIDSDSRKALDVYLECQKTRTAMIKMLGSELFEELSRLEH